MVQFFRKITPFVISSLFLRQKQAVTKVTFYKYSLIWSIGDVYYCKRVYILQTSCLLLDVNCSRWDMWFRFVVLQMFVTGCHILIFMPTFINRYLSTWLIRIYAFYAFV